MLAWLCHCRLWQRFGGVRWLVNIVVLQCRRYSAPRVVLAVLARCGMMELVFSVPLERIEARCWAACPAGPLRRYHCDCPYSFGLPYCDSQLGRRGFVGWDVGERETRLSTRFQALTPTNQRLPRTFMQIHWSVAIMYLVCCLTRLGSYFDVVLDLVSCLLFKATRKLSNFQAAFIILAKKPQMTMNSRLKCQNSYHDTS